MQFDLTFIAYAPDMLSHNAAVTAAVIPPHPLINPFFIKNLSRILREQLHDVKLLFCQRNFFIPAEQTALGIIYGEVPGKLSASSMRAVRNRMGQAT